MRLRHGAGRGRRAVAQHREIALEDAGQPGAVLGLELCEAVDVGEQRVAAPGEIDHFLFETFGVRRRGAAGLRFRASASSLCDSSSASSIISRAFCCASATASSAARCASSNVRWRMSSVSRLRSASGCADFSRSVTWLDALVARPRCVAAARSRRSLTTSSVVAAERLGDLDVSEFSRSDFHAESLILGAGSDGYAQLCPVDGRGIRGASPPDRPAVRGLRNRRCRAGSTDR